MAPPYPVGWMVRGEGGSGWSLCNVIMVQIGKDSGLNTSATWEMVGLCVEFPDNYIFLTVLYHAYTQTVFVQYVTGSVTNR